MNLLPERHILVVDDEADILESLQEALELREYRVSTAKNGREALEILKETPQISLVLLDLMMPVMDGWDLLEILKFGDDAQLSKIPVVIISASRNITEIAQKAASGFLSKPVDLNELYETVERHIGQG